MAKGLTKEQGESIREERLGICADILEEMGTGSEPDLPMPNIRRMAQVMVERFETGDYVLEHGKNWKLSDVYVHNNIKYICSILSKRGEPFAYIREAGEIFGMWKFCSKTEYKTAMTRDHADVATRTETHNQKLDDVQDKWKLDLPHIKEVPLLAN